MPRTSMTSFTILEESKKQDQSFMPLILTDTGPLNPSRLRFQP